MSWDYPSDSDRENEREEDMTYLSSEFCIDCYTCGRKLFMDYDRAEYADCRHCTIEYEPRPRRRKPSMTPQDIQKELVAALGTENQPSQWMAFMDTVTRRLPEILSPGRPSAEAISRSAIGKLGFKSWQAMIEAPAELGGLAWNFSAWKAWRRAWATVQANPWLRNQELTSSEINTMANDTKRLGKPFPGSLEELHELQRAKVTTAEQKRSEALTEAQGALAEARKALAETEGKLAALADQLTQEKITSAGLQKDAGKLQAEIAQLRTQIELLSQPQAVPRSLTRWEHLKAFFGL